MDAGEQPLGVTIRRALEATRRWTKTNTNLGIVLLLAPIARAARATAPRSLRDRVRAVLAATTIADASNAYAAIRLAAPGGLGRTDEQDVFSEPTVRLVEAMTLARERDAIAREYATGFDTTFTLAVPALARARADGLDWDDAIVETYLTLLAEAPDSHIARRAEGAAATALAMQRCAQATLAAGGVRTAGGREAVAALDRDLRLHARNPGATADLTAAAIFVTLLEASL
jgi:triphosphoribosyl-dephospho-CoA synthase